MAITIRSSGAEDALGCATIIHAWGAETPWMVPLDDLEPMAHWWRDYLASDSAWVAETDGQVVGFCVRDDDNITGLYVAQQARNLGVGKRLLDCAKRYRDWITVWAYEKNFRARAFYRREGLVEIGRECDQATQLVDIEHRWTRPK